ncbi:Nn.00g042630.m01.CDS01 [Neocucurbitaria sp. VM-36]
MNPAERTKEALLAKTEHLCNSIADNRNADPWGGDGYLSTILRTIKMEEASDYAPAGQTRLNGAYDYATSAHKELVIKEQAAGLIKTAQDISTLIRDLQELWLFGGLDTLSNPADEEANRVKAMAVAEMMEALAKKSPGGGREIKSEGQKLEDGEE